MADAARRRTKKPVRCAECNRVVCVVEVLLYPTPITDIVRIEGVKCPSCKAMNDATVTVEESLDHAAKEAGK